MDKKKSRPLGRDYSQKSFIHLKQRSAADVIAINLNHGVTGWVGFDFPLSYEQFGFVILQPWI
jgi:hypothetical protein